MTIITISRQFGSGGDDIAEALSQATGYHLFDKRALTRAAAESGLSDVEMLDYSEKNYKIQSFFDRLLGRSRQLGQMRIWRESAEGIRTLEELPLTEDHAVSLVRKAIEMAYVQSNVIIVGRGGQAILKDRPGVLHVRFEAPLEERIHHVRELLKKEGSIFTDAVKARRAAQDEIEIHDMASADYLRRFYGVDWADASLYHLVLNTARFTTPQLVTIIREAAHQIVGAPVAI